MKASKPLTKIQKERDMNLQPEFVAKFPLNFPNKECTMQVANELRNPTIKSKLKLAFRTADIFASFGVLPLLHLRAYTLQDATVYTCSYLYSGNFIISTVKSRYSHCFNCLELFNEDRQYPKNGRFRP